MPAKKRRAALDSAAPAVPSTPAPDADSSNGIEVSASSTTSPAPKKPAVKPAVKRGVKPVAKPAPAAIEPPKRAAAKAQPPAPAVLAPVAVQLPRPTDDEIRQHAYFLSLRRNGRGDPIADWMEAERALRAATD